LATATFQNESASGWQQVSFSTPVAVAANTTYVVSYYAPAGHYAADSGYFASSAAVNPPVQALANGVDGPDGVFRYGTGGVLRRRHSARRNYWVDVVFSTAPPRPHPTVGNVRVAARRPSSVAFRDHGQGNVQ